MAKRYSASERKAFHMGRAFATAKAGGRVVGMTNEQKQSFKNGVKSVRGGKKPAQVQGIVAYIPSVGKCLVDADGCILKVINGGAK